MSARAVKHDASKLDRALARLGQHGGEVHKIAIMNYAPISATVEGEPLEIYPFLGSSQLLEPVQRHKVEAVFHGMLIRVCPDTR